MPLEDASHAWYYADKLSAKKLAVTLVAATILYDRPCTFLNVPGIGDITKLHEVLREMGAEVGLPVKYYIF